MSTQTPSMSSEQTFRSFTLAAASNYAEFRLDYHPTLYSTLLEKHISSGGKLGTLLDVGCGPGTAARTLGTHFQHVIGLDPSEGMIASATKLCGTTGSGQPIRFAVSGAEDLSGIEDGSVDLLIAATAAHWFNLPVFWARAAQVLKSGGSVGLWTHKGSQFADSVPNVVAIREAVDAIRRDHLSGYYRHGSTLSRDLYVNLPMPWSVDPPVSGFDEGSLYRVEWGTGAVKAFPGDKFLAGGHPDVDLDTFEAMLALCAMLCGEDRWHFYQEGQSIKFNSDGTGESTKQPSKTNEEPRPNEPHLLGELELEITLTKRLPEWVSPQALKDYAKLNESSLHDDAFEPKLFKIRMERGHFMEPAYLSSRGATRYSLRLLFDKSPYPVRSEWRQPEGGPDSNEFWNHKEFVGRKNLDLEKQGRAMNDTSPRRWDECIVC
ncbi:hypothetical protein FHL15_002233 [Xylaria flabelliformis]|uniref:Methyltransferase type 11 domain-containing protein n=1 Tax=Xylaria flabelliformis TaxID=2512241 RepID=A0A553I9R7_9PEZI|nr:hypothetical protein FHL15_002233 [Xylaria flabelliformis]